MKQFMKDLWEYLKSVDWDNDKSPETYLLVTGITTVVGVILFVVIDVLDLRFVGILTVFGFVYSVMIVLALMEENFKRKRRDKELADARRYDPENVYGKAVFVDDDGLGDKHFK